MACRLAPTLQANVPQPRPRHPAGAYPAQQPAHAYPHALHRGGRSAPAPGATRGVCLVLVVETMVQGVCLSPDEVEVALAGGSSPI